MKYLLKSIFTFSLLLTLSLATKAQEKKLPKIATTEFAVKGVCGMCKDRIENAALIKGVKFVEWDKEAQSLKVIYKTKKTTEEAIQAAVAEAGHDTEQVKATDEAYSKIHKCCAYREMEVH